MKVQTVATPNSSKCFPNFVGTCGASPRSIVADSWKQSCKQGAAFHTLGVKTAVISRVGVLI
jgi:hypothetical protein